MHEAREIIVFLNPRVHFQSTGQHEEGDGVTLILRNNDLGMKCLREDNKPFARDPIHTFILLRIISLYFMICTYLSIFFYILWLSFCYYVLKGPDENQHMLIGLPF